MPIIDSIVSLLSLLVFVGITVLLLRRFAYESSTDRSVDRGSFELLGSAHALDFSGHHLRPTLQGRYGDCSVRVVARIVQRSWVGRQRIQTDSESAKTDFRVAHRAALPPGFRIFRPYTLFERLSVILNAGLETDSELDARFHVFGDDDERVVSIVSEPRVRKALLHLSKVLPEAVVTDRMIEVTVPGMVTSSETFARTLDAMTAVARALHAIAPLEEGEEGEEGEEQPVDAAGVRATTPSPTAPGPPMSSAELPVVADDLSTALNRLRKTSTVGRFSQAPTGGGLMHASYAFELEVRSVIDATTRSGMATGGKAVRGALGRSAWSAEVQFDPEYNDEITALSAGDVLIGEVEVDKVRANDKTVEGRALQGPTVMKNAPTP